MEYIFLVIAVLICGACVLAVFLESEITDRKIIYEKGKFIKIIKYRNGQVVSRRVFNGKWVDLIYKFIGGIEDENRTN